MPVLPDLSRTPSGECIDRFPAAGFSWLHYGALLLVSLLVNLLYFHEPGFGDELTYWSLAFDLHDIGRAGWNMASFHDLRWPVWGVSWLWQCLFGPGLASFYVGPYLYFAAGAALASTLGRLLFGSRGGAWLCVAAWFLAPALDTTLYRPIPDLSENVWGGGALLAWWVMMNAPAPRRAWLAGAACGVAIGIAYANRVTGLFIAPVLALTTGLFFPRRWKWLLWPAAVAFLVFLAECAVYFAICGDWLHSIHANLGGAGAKDVIATPLWRLPFRYLPLLFHGNPLAPLYTILAGVGTWAGWRERGRIGRLVVVWFYALFFVYSCSIQSLHPVLPLIGGTARYMGSLALPMALLSALGVAHLWSLFRRHLPAQALHLERHRIGVCAGLLVFCVLLSSRPFCNPGFTIPLRRYMEQLPDGTRIFSHHAMRDVAFLVDARDARRYRWTAPRAILVRTPELEQAAAGCDQFWCLRKQVWLAERRKLEHNGSREQPPLGSYLETPERDWTLREVLAQGDSMHIALFARRPEGAPPPHVLTSSAPEWGGLVPALPLEWNSGSQGNLVKTRWPVPASLRGKRLSFRIEGSSSSVEPLDLSFEFSSKGRRAREIFFKPIFYRSGGKDFFELAVPPEAERCDVQLRSSKNAREVKWTDFRAVYDDAP